MVYKGFIFFHETKIPFVIEEYKMELFTDDPIIYNFTKEYNFKSDYVLSGQCYWYAGLPSKVYILVSYSIGTTCYLTSFLFCKFGDIGEYEKIGFQSSTLDSIFQYTHKLINGTRDGVNYSIAPVDIYKFTIPINEKCMEFRYAIGHNNRLGIIEDFTKKGELIVSPCPNDIVECTRLMRLVDRFSQFTVGYSDIKFKCIVLYKEDFPSAYLFCNRVDSEEQSAFDGMFFEFDAAKYCPRILENMALDMDNTISKSIPIGHLSGKTLPYSPHRLIEQVFSFEYLFDKIHHCEVQSMSLKNELKMMFDLYPEILTHPQLTSEKAAEEIKTIRVNITHGYKYYYNFDSDRRIQLLMIMLDKLIERMSLQHIGFERDDIQKFREW